MTECIQQFQVKARKQPVLRASQPDFARDTSLSSMWAIGRFHYLEDFFTQARQLGFSNLELNHQVDSDMLEGLDLSEYRFSSLHEPCPADIPTSVLGERDWLISAIDEDCRKQGVRVVQRSLNLADDLGCKVVIIHGGRAGPDQGLEARLRRMFQAGQIDSPEYLELKEQLVKAREQTSGPKLEAVQKSLRELLEYASRLGICLGLENRYHFMDIPTLDEMQVLLELADSDRLGFWYDVGHAQAMHQLGFYPHEQWLSRYASRMVGVHLHDVRGLNDHFSPGMGEVDFDMVASYLPSQALRTFELSPINTPEQVQAGLKYLIEKGCVKAQ
jgi:sugar phosphate isomerase/epimerase